MSEVHKEDQDRWRELHDLLGLPPEGGSPTPAAARPKPAAPPPSLPAQEPAWQAPRAPAVPPEPESAPAERAYDARAGLEAAEPSVADEIPPPRDEAGPPGPRDQRGRDDDEDSRQRGRRRGRRGKRSRGRRDEGDAPAGRDRPARPPAEEDAVPDTIGDFETPTRRDASPRAAEEDFDEEAPEEVEEALAAEEDDDDEPIETFSDWNVPSWNEIVASLYRPER